MNEVYTDLEKKFLHNVDVKCLASELEMAWLTSQEDWQKLAAYLLDNYTLTKKRDSKVGQWIDSWLEIFPKGMKSGGKLVRSDRKGCLNKMTTFLKEYKFDKDLIMKATKQYVDEKLDSGSYMRCAIYFIGKKGEGSDLAAACENFEEPKQDYISNNDFI